VAALSGDPGLEGSRALAFRIDDSVLHRLGDNEPTRPDSGSPTTTCINDGDLLRLGDAGRKTSCNNDGELLRLGDSDLVGPTASCNNEFELLCVGESDRV